MKYDWLDWDEEDIAQYEDAQANFAEGKRLVLSGLDHIKYAMSQAGRLRVPAAYKKWAREQVALWKREDESVSRNLNRHNLAVFDYMLRHPEEFEEAIQEADKFASQEDAAFTAGVLPKIIKEYGFSPDEHSIEDIVEAFVSDEVIARGDGRHELQVELAAESLGFGYDSFYRQPRFRG